MSRRSGPAVPPTPLSIGQPVLVIALKRNGAIVEVRGEKYRVAVGGLTMTCDRRALQSLEPPTPRSKEPSHRAGPRPDAGRSEPGRTSSIDLHGLTVEDARSALIAHVDRALRSGDASVEVVHGVGTGRVRAAVLETLTSIPSVRAVKPHPTNRGVTIALF